METRAVYVIVAWNCPLLLGPSQLAVAKKVTSAIARESTRATSSMATLPTAREPIVCGGWMGLPAAWSATGGPGKDLVGRHQPFGPGAGEVDPDARFAGGAQLPAGGEEAGAVREVFGLGHLAAVG